MKRRQSREHENTNGEPCICEGGPHRAQAHAKPHAKAADHGNPFSRTKGCIHSELQLQTQPGRIKRVVRRTHGVAIEPMHGPPALNFDHRNAR